MTKENNHAGEKMTNRPVKCNSCDGRKEYPTMGLPGFLDSPGPATGDSQDTYALRNQWRPASPLRLVP